MNKAAIHRELRAAAVEIDGQRWVRASMARKILRLSPGWQQVLPRRHGVIEFRQSVPVTRGASKGIVVWWALDGLLAFAAMRAATRRGRAWTRKEDERLIDLLATHSVQEAAKVMHRPFRSVISRIDRLGSLRTIWRDHHRLITSGQLMKLTRKSDYGTIRRWRSMGLECVRTTSRRSDALFRLPDVRRFLMDHPNILIVLHPDARKLLRLTTADIEGRAA